jgi:hypothetical protein
MDGSQSRLRLRGAKKSPKSLMRMLDPKGNSQARNFFEIVAYLQKKEGLCLRVRSA